MSNIEMKMTHFLQHNAHALKLLSIAFVVNVIIYGQKLFFYALSPDDYAMFFGPPVELAGISGRWMASIANKYIFAGALQVLPFLYGLIGVLSFTFAGFLTARIFQRKNVYEIMVVTLLISATPFVAHSLYFTVGIMGWLTTMLGVVSIFIVYKPNKFGKFLGLVLLTCAIGTYQTIFQVCMSIVIIKTALDILKAQNSEELKKIVLHFFGLMVFIISAFVCSIVINTIYIEYHHLSLSHRYEKVISGQSLNLYIGKALMVLKSFTPNYKFMYASSLLNQFVKAMFYLAILSGMVGLLKSRQERSLKCASVLILILLFLSIPLVIELPFIAGSDIPLRAHYTVGWFIAGFFCIAATTFKGKIGIIVKGFPVLLILINILYINVYFYAANRQTSADIMRANQIVNRIRMDRNYLKEPVKLKIIGEKRFSVIGWHSGREPLNKSWAKYLIFKHFTDLEFEVMSNDEYSKIVNYIRNMAIKIHPYPGKNSIVVNQNSVVLFLSDDEQNKVINNK